MGDTIKLSIDGQTVEGKPGQTIMEAADEAGVYIPRLCMAKDLNPCGRCRVCTVNANGRYVCACTMPITDGMVVLNDTGRLNEMRRAIVEMLFVEGNHICSFCEESGECELQAMARRLKMDAPRFPFQYPKQDVDMSHPDVWIDRNRCIKCGRCIRASRDIDGKSIFAFVDRGPAMRLAVAARGRLSDTQIAAADRAVEACPVGALMIKREGYHTPYGRRTYDRKRIGADIEDTARAAVSQETQE
jgi:[NiFe] hydrogenase diaphorase moiety small subunit